MPGESSVLLDICRDFCFPKHDAPFTRESSTMTTTATGGKVERGDRLLMKTQEASRRKTRLRRQEEPAVVAYTFLSSPLTKCMSFHYSLMLRPLLRPLY